MLWFKKKLKKGIERFDGWEDRGDVERHWSEEKNRWLIQCHSACNTTVRIAINNNRNTYHRYCPKCLCTLDGLLDPEEEWLRKRLGGS